MFDVHKNLFQDPESDQLQLTVLCKNSSLPNWLSFNKNLAIFTGTPSITDVTYSASKHLYYQEFPTITATDIVDNKVSVSFKIIYSNKAPKLKVRVTTYALLQLLRIMDFSLLIARLAFMFDIRHFILSSFWQK